MGFLSEIKKLLFVKKAVAKSGAEKVGDFAVDKGKDIADKSIDVLKDTGEVIVDKTSGLRDAVLDKSGDAFESIKDTAGDTMSTLGDTVKSAGDKILDKAKDTFDTVADADITKKAASVAESVGDKVLDTGEAFMEKAKGVMGEVIDSDAVKGAKDVAENVGEKVLDVKDDLVERAKEKVGDLKETLDETIDKAEAMAEHDKLNPPKEFADNPLDASGSLLDDTDDFFSKADKYADGDYGAFSEGKTTIIKDTGSPDPDRPAVKAAGFEDLDGDGDEIIDDALILEDLPDEPDGD